MLTMCHVTVVNILCPLIHVTFTRDRVVKGLKRCGLPDSPSILPYMLPE